jgi:uncharacterized peroxidase-related enzyme
MPRLEPLPIEDSPELGDIAATSKARLGFVANSARTMARRPEIVRAFMQLALAIHGASSTVDARLRNMIAQVAGRAGECSYCMAHTAHSAAHVELPANKQTALWNYETSPLFSEAERAALRVANGAAKVPNAVTDKDFAALKKHFREDQIVEIVAVIAMTAFLGCWNGTMATELEAVPLQYAQKVLAPHGWKPGKHAPAKKK